MFVYGLLLIAISVVIGVLSVGYAPGWVYALLAVGLALVMAAFFGLLITFDWRRIKRRRREASDFHSERILTASHFRFSMNWFETSA